MSYTYNELEDNYAGIPIGTSAWGYTRNLQLAGIISVLNAVGNQLQTTNTLAKQLETDTEEHINAVADSHEASAISVTGFDPMVNVQQVLEELMELIEGLIVIPTITEDHISFSQNPVIPGTFTVTVTLTGDKASFILNGGYLLFGYSLFAGSETRRKIARMGVILDYEISGSDIIYTIITPHTNADKFTKFYLQFGKLGRSGELYESELKALTTFIEEIDSETANLYAAEIVKRLEILPDAVSVKVLDELENPIEMNIMRGARLAVRK